MGSRLRSLVRELNRRRVFRVAAIYAVSGIATVEAADLLFPRLGLPNWTVQLVLGLAIVGFPIALVLAWAYRLTPDGLENEAPAEGDVHADPRAPRTTPDASTRHSAAPASELGSVVRDRDTLLVLPFDDMGADRENEYFSDGLTEEIIASLSRIHALGVISRTSAMRLKGTDMDVRSIGRELGVRYVLEGSVRKSGDDLRITAQLIDARTDEHVWVDTYDGTVTEVFQIQERVAGAIASALRIELSPAEERELRRRRIDDPVAHESYLRARHEMWGFSKEGVEKARRHVLNAIEIVGDNELLLATLGHIHVWFLQAGIDSDLRHLEEAEECARAIFRLDPESRHGTRLRGLIEFQRGDLRAARPYLQESLERDPDDPDTLLMLGYLCCLVGREEKGLALFRHSLRIDPLTPLNHAMPGFVAIMQGRFADAIEPYRTFYRMDDGGPFSMMDWVWALGLNGRLDEAEPVVRELAEKHPDSPLTATAQALFHGFRGDSDATLAAITPALREAGRRTEMFARFLAESHAMAGDVDGAIDWLERAVDVGLANHPYLARIDPTLANLRGEPRFEALLDRVEAEWRAFQP